jgi:hypothetical protein
MSVAVACRNACARMCGVVPAQTEDQLAGIGLRIGDELGDGADRDPRRHHEHMRPVHHGGDRHETLQRIEFEIRIGDRKVAEHIAAHQQRIAVGRCRCGGLGAGGLAGAGPVLDDDALADAQLQLLRNRPGDHVARGACDVRHDDPDHAARIGFGGRCSNAGDGHQQRDQQTLQR